MINWSPFILHKLIHFNVFKLKSCQICKRWQANLIRIAYKEPKHNLRFGITRNCQLRPPQPHSLYIFNDWTTSFFISIRARRHIACSRKHDQVASRNCLFERYFPKTFFILPHYFSRHCGDCAMPRTICILCQTSSCIPPSPFPRTQILYPEKAGSRNQDHMQFKISANITRSSQMVLQLGNTEPLESEFEFAHLILLIFCTSTQTFSQKSNDCCTCSSSVQITLILCIMWWLRSPHKFSY